MKTFPPIPILLTFFNFWFWPPFDLYWPPLTPSDLLWQKMSNNWFLQLKTFPSIPILLTFFIFDFWPPFDLYWPLVTSCDLWWQKFSNNWILHLKTFPTIPKLLTFLFLILIAPKGLKRAKTPPNGSSVYYHRFGAGGWEWAMEL